MRAAEGRVLVKKGVKWAALIAAGLIPAIANHIIYKKTRRRVDTPATTDHFFPWRFGKVHYTVCGQGRPLLLVHGIGPGRSLLEWQASIALLARHHRVYAIDLLGFGRSETPAVSYSAYLYVSLIHDFMRKVIRREATVIAEGHSAAYAVMACVLAPKRVTGLILVAPEGVCEPAPYAPLRRKLMKMALDFPWLGTSAHNLQVSRLMVRRYLRSFVHHPAAASHALIEQHYLLAHAGGSSARFVTGAKLAGFLKADIRHVLHQIKNPIQVVWGEYNQQNPVERLEAVRRLNPHIKAAVVKNTGGLPYLENPRAFYRACMAFINR